VFFVENLDVDSARVQSVFADQRNGDRESIIVAARGDIETHTDGARFLVLSHGRRYEGAPGTAEHRVLEFERYAIRLDVPPEAPMTSSNARSLSTVQLLIDRSPRNLGELLGRIALPVASIVLALLAVPLAYVNPRVGRSANLILATLLALIYLNSLQIMQASVQRGRMGFATAVWLAHAVAMALLVVLFVRRVYLRRWLPRWPRPLLRTGS
jgi:lipopolysaccharide export system permease protein